MKQLIVLLFAFLCVKPALSQETESLPDHIASRVRDLKGFTLVTQFSEQIRQNERISHPEFVRGDLNGDSFADYIVMVSRNMLFSKTPRHQYKAVAFIYNEDAQGYSMYDNMETFKGPVPAEFFLHKNSANGRDRIRDIFLFEQQQQISTAEICPEGVESGAANCTTETTTFPGFALPYYFSIQSNRVILFRGEWN